MSITSAVMRYVTNPVTSHDEIFTSAEAALNDAKDVLPQLIEEASEPRDQTVLQQAVELRGQSQTFQKQALSQAATCGPASLQCAISAAFLATNAGALDVIARHVSGQALPQPQAEETVEAQRVETVRLLTNYGDAVTAGQPADALQKTLQGALDVAYQAGANGALALLTNNVAQPTAATPQTVSPGTIKLAAKASQCAAVASLLGGSSAPLAPAMIFLFGATSNLYMETEGNKSLKYMAEKGILDGDKNPVVLLSHETMPLAKYEEQFQNGGSDHLTPAGQERFHKLVVAGCDEQGNIRSANFGKPQDFEALKTLLKPNQSADFYFAVPPKLFPSALQMLKEMHMVDQPADGSYFRRVMLEKPFGTSPETAAQLAEIIAKNYEPGQVLLMDHFLAKPGVLNTIAVRTDPDIDAAISNKHVREVKVKIFEKVGSNERPYFRETGELRDMVHSHGFALLDTAVGDLPKPQLVDGPHIRHARVDVLENVDIDMNSVQRGQFVGFNDIKGATPSDKESFVSFDFNVNTPRWTGTRFNITAAKGVSEKCSSVELHLDSLPAELVKRMNEADPTANVTESSKAVLTFLMNPDAKATITLADSKKVFEIPEDPRLHNDPTYVRAFRDAIQGQKAIFADKQEAIASWNHVERIEKLWASTAAAPMISYSLGDDGSHIADSKVA